MDLKTSYMSELGYILVVFKAGLRQRLEGKFFYLASVQSTGKVSREGKEARKECIIKPTTSVSSEI